MSPRPAAAAAYDASVFLVGVGVVYALLLGATLLSALLMPIALAAAPFVAAFVIVSLATIPGFPRTFAQVLKEFGEKPAEAFRPPRRWPL